MVARVIPPISRRLISLNTSRFGTPRTQQTLFRHLLPNSSCSRSRPQQHPRPYAAIQPPQSSRPPLCDVTESGAPRLMTHSYSAVIPARSISAHENVGSDMVASVTGKGTKRRAIHVSSSTQPWSRDASDTRHGIQGGFGHTITDNFQASHGCAACVPATASKM